MKRRRTKRLFVRPATSEERKLGSPYWNWVYNHADSNGSGEIKEPPEANPDVLSDEFSMRQESVTEEDTEKRKHLRSVLRRALDKLTETDREIVTIMSRGCHNISKIAEKIGMSRGFVRHRLMKIQSLSAKMLESSYINGSTIQDQEN